MSSLYTTKSLGRAWLPSPVRSKSSRYAPWPDDTPKLRWLTTESQRSRCWSKIHERFALLTAVLLLGIWWCTLDRTQFLSRLPSWSWNLKQDYSDYAYITSASNEADLCSSVMQLESLHRLDVKAERMLIYPEAWDSAEDSAEAQLVRQAKEEYGALLRPVANTVLSMEAAVLAFNQTAYKRVLALDPNSTILRSMDDMFFSRLSEGGSDSAVLLSPSSALFQELQSTDGAMEIIGKHGCSVPQTFQTKRLREKDPSSMPLSSKVALIEATLVHFSDGAPWKHMLDAERAALQPTCSGGQEPCDDLEVWQWLYDEFRARRTAVCGEHFNEWEFAQAMEDTNRRIIPLQERVRMDGTVKLPETD